jgi:hypothetical protein
MPFRPNYRRDRLDRDRAARARADEKQQKRNELSAKRKAERSDTEVSPDDEQALNADQSSAKAEPED